MTNCTASSYTVFTAITVLHVTYSPQLISENDPHEYFPELSAVAPQGAGYGATNWDFNAESASCVMYSKREKMASKIAIYFNVERLHFA